MENGKSPRDEVDIKDYSFRCSIGLVSSHGCLDAAPTILPGPAHRDIHSCELKTEPIVDGGAVGPYLVYTEKPISLKLPCYLVFCSNQVQRLPAG